MQVDPHHPTPSAQPEQNTSRTFEQATRQLDAHREKLRELVKEMDQEVADADQRRANREADDKGIGEMHTNEWKLPADFDARIREWMGGQGWTANSTRDYLDEEVYAWRQDTRSGSSPTLWVARAVIDKYPVSKVIEHLDQSAVADRMRNNPKTRFIVTEEAGKLVVKAWPHAE